MPASISERVLRAFNFLVTEFSFEVEDTHDGQREISVSFKCNNTEVYIFYEIYGSISVIVNRLNSDQSRDGFGLRFIVRDAHPDDETQLDANAYVDLDALPDALERQAKALRKSGADMLHGDFSRATRVKQLQVEEHRRYNIATFGTSTGETPRFSTQPTLEKLFADAAGEVLLNARCYQALWDYHYSLEEIAAYLNVTTPDVQKRLDRWEK